MSKPNATQRDASALLGVALALLTAVVLAPTPARAGCWHDLSAGSDAPDQFRLLRACKAIGPGADARPDDSPPGHREGRPVGCTGPSCSGRPDLPMIPTSFDPPRALQWAIVEVPPPATTPRPTPRYRDERHPRSILVVEAIFHPPRPTAPAV